MSRGKSITKLLLDASQEALFAGIEIHNKPHIAYRYPTASILIINAWELALKAYVYKYINKNQIYVDKDKKHTITFLKALGYVKDDINHREGPSKFQIIYDNLTLLENYRNSNVHYLGDKLDPIVFMLMSKSILLYDTFLKKYFNKDITKNDNLIILPIGLKLPLNPIDYLKQDFGSAHNAFVNDVIYTIKSLSDKGIQESIVIGFDVFAGRVREEKNADILAAITNEAEAIPLRKAIRYTDDPNAPVFRVTTDLPPLSYKQLREKIKEKKPTIVFNTRFNTAMKVIKANPKLCQKNYLDPHRKNGSSKCFYTHEAVDAVIAEYEKQESI